MGARSVWRWVVDMGNCESKVEVRFQDADFGNFLNWQLVAVGCAANGFRRRAVVNTVAAALVRTDIGLKPRDAFLIVAFHHGQAGARAVGVDRDLQAVGKRSFDQVAGNREFLA